MLNGIMRYENEFECMDILKWIKSYKEIICEDCILERSIWWHMEDGLEKEKTNDWDTD